MKTKRKTLPKRYEWLRKMRALLAKKGGWIKHSYHNRHGGYCLVGARAAVDDLSPVLMRSDDIIYLAGEVAKALDIQIPEHDTPFAAVTEYNDAKRRTKKQVLARIDAAIRRLSK